MKVMSPFLSIVVLLFTACPVFGLDAMTTYLGATKPIYVIKPDEAKYPYFATPEQMNAKEDTTGTELKPLDVGTSVQFNTGNASSNIMPVIQVNGNIGKVNPNNPWNFFGDLEISLKPEPGLRQHERCCPIDKN